MEEDEGPDTEPFTIPLPHPPFPTEAHDRFLFVRHAGGDAETGREHEDIMLRRVPRETAMRFRAAAGGRGLTHAQYLARLVELHGKLRARADGGDEAAQAVLAELELGTVTV